MKSKVNLQQSKGSVGKINTNWINKEKVAESTFLICASLAIFSLLLIVIYIFAKGIPGITKIGLIEFLFTTKWNPSEEAFGIGAMIIGSFASTIGAIILSALIGLSTAIFLSEIAPRWIVSIFKPGIELLAGIPSVVYGFFGLVVIVPIIDSFFGGGGNSLLAAIIILAIMVLPTIISISEVSLRSVPKEYKEGSLALGATKMQTIFKVLVPAAKSGIMASIVLGTGRAIGETMAVILVAGNSVIIPESLASRIRTLTSNIALEMGYAFGIHQEALFATGVVLFVFIIILNIILNYLIRRSGDRA